MEIKDLIKQRRLEKGYSLEDVAKRVGVSRQTVQKWETGKIENMRRSSVAALSSALGIPIEALLGWDAPEDPDLFTTDKKYTFAQRLRELLDHYGIRQADLAARTGISKSSLSHYLKGDWEGKQDVIYKISSAYGVSSAWLMGVDCPMQPDAPTAPDLFTLPGILPVPPMVRKPLIGTIACGTPILAEQNVDKYIAVPEDIRCDFALRCEGDSMIGIHIMPGAAVYIREQPDVENGEIAAVIVDDESATLKKVYKTDSTITLLAENPAYAPIIITGERLQHVRILGVVVAWTNYL